MYAENYVYKLQRKTRNWEYFFQICGDGSIFKHLMGLILDPTLKKSVLIIISNLCYTKNARPGLGSAGAVQLVIKELKNAEENNEGKLISTSWDELSSCEALILIFIEQYWTLTYLN